MGDLNLPSGRELSELLAREYDYPEDREDREDREDLLRVVSASRCVPVRAGTLARKLCTDVGP